MNTRKEMERKTENQVERLNRKKELESVGLQVEDILDRTRRKIEIQNHSGDSR